MGVTIDRNALDLNSVRSEIFLEDLVVTISDKMILVGPRVGMGNTKMFLGDLG